MRLPVQPGLLGKAPKPIVSTRPNPHSNKRNAKPRVRAGLQSRRKPLSIEFSALAPAGTPSHSGSPFAIILLFLLPFLVVAASPALEPTTPLANLNRQGWVMENGLPQNTVKALAQTNDGFLWLGTEVGLARFDGASFTVFDEHSKPALPSGDIRCLLAAKDGSLWIGTPNGLARLKDGLITTFTTADGLPANDVDSLAQTNSGDLWANTIQGIAHLHGGRFEVMPANGPRSPVNAIGIGPYGELWAATVDGLYQDWEGKWSGPNFANSLAGTVPRFMGSTRDGGWVIASNSTVLLLDRAGGVARLAAGRELPGTRIQRLFVDREGDLWVGTSAGLVRVEIGQIRIERGAEGRISVHRPAPVLEKLPLTDPLASASILSILEDREGNLWVGTESNGLQILRDSRFTTLTTRDGLASDNITTVVEDRTGTLWIGTSGSGITALHPGSSTPARTYAVKDGLPSDVILSLAAASSGDLWIGTPDGLARLRRGAIQVYTSADGLADDFIRSLLVDPDGSLWIGTRRGLTHWTKPGDLASPIETYTHANGLGSDLVGAMARDTAGDLWIATFNGLSRLHTGKITNYTTANGLSSNVITAILPQADGAMLIGTQDHGWIDCNGQIFSSPKQPEARTASIHAILDDGHWRLWFATGEGISRCALLSATRGSHLTDCAPWMTFSTADGLRSRETAINSHPSAFRAASGLLYFATPKGLVQVDPAHFPVNTVPPPIAIERFAVDDTDAALHDPSLRVPAGHNHFQFDYAALSFVAPQKVRYRYMLEGFDHHWTDAGARRTAFYTNIRHGRYTFRVQASNNDGVWNLAGAALEFDLQPHFYQTVWFYVLLALGILALIGLALRLRLLRAEREFKAVLNERNRIAREIHDTLAQGYVGVSVQLEVISELLRQHKPDAASRHLDATRIIVREGLADARQSIWALRSQDAAETTLPIRLRRLVEQARAHSLAADFSIHGAYRPLPPGTESEFLRVAQEAIHNVKKHSGAAHLNVQLEYSAASVSLEVRDDGRGFASTPNGAAPETGHYGLTGMRERAAAIGGTLEVTSEPGAGATVRLSAPIRTEAAPSRDTADTKEQA